MPPVILHIPKVFPITKDFVKIQYSTKDPRVTICESITLTAYDKTMFVTDTLLDLIAIT